MSTQLKDGYEWLVRFDNKFLKKHLYLRNIALFYFIPFETERYKKGLFYRLLGVQYFGKFLPTGGIKIRRFTKMRMPAYSLKATNVSSMKEFLYKNCFFELLHLPFFLFLLFRSFWWVMVASNYSLAFELLFVNAIFNIYPIMHQRFTRVRIFTILKM